MTVEKNVGTTSFASLRFLTFLYRMTIFLRVLTYLVFQNGLEYYYTTGFFQNGA